MGWDGTGKSAKKASEKEDGSSDPISFEHFTDEDVEQWIKEQQEAPIASAICCGIQGLDGTAKSGIVLDCRTEEEIDEGKKIYVIDADGSVAPLKLKYWDNDPNIIVIDPMMFDDDGHIDYISTYAKTLANVRYLRRKEKDLNLAAVSIDGLDVVLKACEKVMRTVDLRLDPEAKIKDQWDWNFRNERFLEPLILLKRMKCHRFFVTHMKEKRMYVQKGGKKALETVGYEPNWERTTPNMLFQRIELVRKEPDNGLIEIEANIIKCKTNIKLEGKRYLVAKVDTRDEGDETAEWYGLKDFYRKASYAGV